MRKESAYFAMSLKAWKVMNELATRVLGRRQRAACGGTQQQPSEWPSLGMPCTEEVDLPGPDRNLWARSCIAHPHHGTLRLPMPLRKSGLGQLAREAWERKSGLLGWRRSLLACDEDEGEHERCFRRQSVGADGMPTRRVSWHLQLSINGTTAAWAFRNPVHRRDGIRGHHHLLTTGIFYHLNTVSSLG